MVQFFMPHSVVYFAQSAAKTDTVYKTENRHTDKRKKLWKHK